MTTSSIRHALDREENRIKDDILRMGSMVESAIDNSIAALKQRDGALAQQVIEDDKQINQLRYKIEEECLTAIATQQPAAHDLRMLDQPLLKPLIDMPVMANIVKEMTRSALDSFMRTDVELARQTITRDDEVDQMYQQIFRELLTYMLEDPKNISRATFLLWVAHNLERIGDRATNLCERTIFVATGLMGDLQSGQTGPLAPLK
jgi:phosphate transport system protein